MLPVLGGEVEEGKQGVAMIPITTAALAPTNAQGAVIATSPASMPLQAIEP